MAVSAPPGPQQTTLLQDDFSAGKISDVAPALIDPRGLFESINGLYGEDGSNFRRGGTAYKSNAGLGSSGQTFLFDGYFDAGQRTFFANSADFGVLGGDDATPVNLGSDGLPYPKGSALLDSCLFIGGGYIYGGSRKAAYSAGTVTLTNGSKTVTGSSTSFSANVDAGMLIQRGNERVYVVASVDSNTQLTLKDAYAGVTGSGISYTLSPVYKMTASDPYEIADFYAVCENRLLWSSANKIRFSAVDDPHTAWDTDNEHDLPEGAIVTGFGIPSATALVFSTAGAWTLAGLSFEIVDPATGNPQHKLQSLARDRILFGQTGIADWSQSLVVPCEDGIYLMDGISSPTKISKNTIDRLYRTYVTQGYRPGGAITDANHYFLPIITSAGDVVDLLVCRLDRPVKIRGQLAFPWGRFTGSGGSIVAFAKRILTAAPDPVLLGAESNNTSRVLDCSPYFSPDAAHKNDADGTSHIWEVITRDYATGGETINMVRALKTRAELVDAGSDNPHILFDWSDGARAPGLPSWDDPAGVWDVGFGPSGTAPWQADEAELGFLPLACQMPASTGLDPFKCRVNKPARFIRFRARCNDPCASLVLRSFELVIRPSQAVRR